MERTWRACFLVVEEVEEEEERAGLSGKEMERPKEGAIGIGGCCKMACLLWTLEPQLVVVERPGRKKGYIYIYKAEAAAGATWGGWI
jgi:hypothetical protein